MFERFTDRARRVVVLAQEEARILNHNYIGTEHILLGLVHEGEGIAAKALESIGISLHAIRQQVEEIIGRGQSAPTGHIPFTPRAKKVLEMSLREALQLGHKYIGTEHILLGLIREGEGVGAQVLVKLGADLSHARQEVIGLLSGYTGEEIPEEERTQEVEGGTGYRPMPPGPSAMALFDERAVFAIHRAQQIAAKRHRAVLVPEDVFLGLLSAGDPEVASILRDLGLDLDRIRERISEVVDERGKGSAGEEAEEPGP